MKKGLCIIIFITIKFTSFSQNVLDSIHPLFKGELNGDLIRKHFTTASTPLFTRNKGIVVAGQREPEIILEMFHSNSVFHKTGLTPVKPLPELIRFGKEPISIYQKNNDAVYETNSDYDFFATPLFDSLGIIVTASGINKQNAHEYEFRVIENRTKEIIAWRPIILFCQSYTLRTKPDGTEETEMGYLGEFKTSFGNGLTIEIRKKPSGLFLTSVSALWINRVPSVLGTFSNTDMQHFLSVFKQQWKHDFMPIGASTYYGDIESAPIDSLLVAKKDFKATENSIIFYLNDKIKSKDFIEYNLVSGKHNSDWKSNDFDLNLIWLKNLSPGKYNLQMRYSIQRQNVSEYKFTIAPAWHQTLVFKIIAGTLGLIVLSFIMILFISRKQKQKLKLEQLQKQQTQTELKSIRSQFNPHFVFNALSSIQGLITKNDMDGANRYLTEFGTLLRDSLKESSKESVSLFTETKMLESYLRLEQLRFGFTYSITTDEAIDRNAVEVPALLLQPLAENAVKHGISPLYDKGNLTLNFKKSSSDMLAVISDNGNGFNPSEATTGYGLKLTHDRIALLNKMLKGQLIELSTNSTDEGTTVHLLFKNWLS